jgi:hypothetical protein
MARVLSSNIVLRAQHNPACADAAAPDSDKASGDGEINEAPLLPAESPITRAFQTLWGPEVDVLDLAAPHAAQGD